MSFTDEYGRPWIKLRNLLGHDNIFPGITAPFGTSRVNLGNARIVAYSPFSSMRARPRGIKLAIVTMLSYFRHP